MKISDLFNYGKRLSQSYLPDPQVLHPPERPLVELLRPQILRRLAIHGNGTFSDLDNEEAVRAVAELVTRKLAIISDENECSVTLAITRLGLGYVEAMRLQNAK